jgi:methylthioribose-1-phosphate isomerase
MWDAIRRLVVRGAPAIGISAAFGVYLGIKDSTPASFVADLHKTCDYLASSRPTAVNLFWAIERIRTAALAEHAAALAAGGSGARPPSGLSDAALADVKARILRQCLEMIDQDNAVCRAIGELGADLIAKAGAGQSVCNILTHCNAGGLATAQFGTALAPVYVAAERGMKLHVFVDETRPLLQGSRITAFELMQNRIPCTLICDNMAAAVMQGQPVAAVIVGADRVAANGDVANKIGTLPLAIVARHFAVPFYVAAPTSSIDNTLASGELIPIEQRSDSEITEGFGRRTAPPGVRCFNPAFDLTPARLITGIITEKGVVQPGMPLPA